MQLQPWVIASWPIIERPCDEVLESATDLQHLGTTVSGDCDEFGRLLGNTIWGAADLRIGLAWDWTEAHDGVFALSDPMGVVSNIGFIDEAGEVVPDRLSAVHLNRIAHELPWQVEVAKATHAVRMSNPWSRRAESIWDALRTKGEDDSWKQSPRRAGEADSSLQNL